MQIPNTLLVPASQVILSVSKTFFFHSLPYLISKNEWRRLLLVHYYYILFYIKSGPSAASFHLSHVVERASGYTRSLWYQGTHHFGNWWWCTTSPYFFFTRDKAPTKVQGILQQHLLTVFPFRQWMCQFHTQREGGWHKCLKLNILWNTLNVQRISRIADLWNFPWFLILHLRHPMNPLTYKTCESKCTHFSMFSISLKQNKKCKVSHLSLYKIKALLFFTSLQTNSLYWVPLKNLQKT